VLSIVPDSGAVVKLGKILFFIVCGGIVLGLLAGIGGYFYYSSTLPSIKSLAGYMPPIITQVYSDNGEVIGEFATERRIVVTIDKIPPVLAQAFVASEDSQFFQHKGVSYIGILRAMIKNIRAGRIAQGGSTITQQVVRSFLLSRERTISRKTREILLAHRLEKYLTKREILYLYLNQIYLGHGNYGVEAAARDYFGKSTEDLGLAEAAMLAGLPKAPERYSPFRNLSLAKQRQAYVLKRMVEDGYISLREAETAYRIPLEFTGRENRYLNVAPYFTEYVRIYLEEKYGREALYTEGLQVHTSLNVSLQRAAQEALEQGLINLDRRQGYRGPERVLQEDDIEPFCAEVAQMLIDDPVRPGGVYPGVVTGFSKKKDRVTVRVGNQTGYIPFKSMRWARRPDPTVEYREAPLKDPTDALAVGYVIKVTCRELDAKDRPLLELYQEPQAQASIVAMELPTGYVKAMVGGHNFLESQFNRAVQAHRQPGSAFKPIVYAAALDKDYTTASIIVDSPVIYYDEMKGENWKPRNFEERFYGPTTFRNALVHSRNVITIKLVRDIGIPYVVRYAQQLGIASELTPDLSLSLGSSELTLLELVRAYAVFAARGHLLTPIFITRVLDRTGTVLEEHEPLPLEIDFKKSQGEIVEEDLRHDEPTFYPQVTSEQTAFIMTNLLEDVVKHGTGWRVKALGRPCAGKTGTTNDYTDAWFVGYTPKLIAGVWVGFDEKKPLGKYETGSRAASPIWLSFMKAALQDTPARDFPTPEGIVFAKIDPKTGLLANPGTDGALFECFKEGTEPSQYTQDTTVVNTQDFLESDILLQGGQL
jgi:penicillin-binding protein 1A